MGLDRQITAQCKLCRQIELAALDDSDTVARYGSTYQGFDAEQLECSNSDNAPSVSVYSEVYGADSKCFETNSGEGRCYQAACVRNEMAVKFNVRGEWFTCQYDFQEISVRVAGGTLPVTVICPRLSSACPDLFCPFNCAGRGVCNYAASVNGTNRPRCECFDETDTSEGCSDSLIPDGRFFEDSSGLFNNLEENFFDPLIAVFVDHPDKVRIEASFRFSLLGLTSSLSQTVDDR